MKTKAQIIQSLLEEKKIDVEEAMVLMMNDDRVVYVTLPVNPVYPQYPISPYPFNPVLPYYQVTCNAANN